MFTLIAFILFLNSCLLKEKKSNLHFKEDINLGKLIKEKLILKIDCPEHIEIYLKYKSISIKGIKKEDFYEFFIEREGFYTTFINSEEYIIEETRINIFKLNNRFYYKGPEEIYVKKVLKNEPIKISQEKIQEEPEEKITELINLLVKTNIEVSNNNLQKPNLVPLKSLGNKEIKENLIGNSKFVNNDVGDYFEMPNETKQKEKLFGEKLKENLSSYKGIISTCANILSDTFLKPEKINEEEVKQEALNRTQEKAEKVKKDQKSENDNTNNLTTPKPELKPDPKDIEKIRARKQKENQDKEKVQKRFVESVNNTLKDVPKDPKDNKALEVLNKAYEIFKKTNN